jgi:integrase
LTSSHDAALINSFQSLFLSQFPDAVRSLQDFDKQYLTAKSRKGFYLAKVVNKKHGFLYYVRYNHDGRVIPSKWNTHTNDLQQAILFAQKNRDSIISAYFRKHLSVYSILEKYYQKGSSYLAIDERRNLVLGEKTRSVYFHFIVKIFIPFLKDRKAQSFDDITPALITSFQDFLLEKGNKPQTINRYLGSVKAVFSHLLIRDIIKTNVFSQVLMLRVKSDNFSLRGCYDIEQLKGVFNSPWDDPLSYLLCLLIYSTGMRNSEIEKLQAKDICQIDSCHFIDIKQSKTKNGVRLVPLHGFVFRRLSLFIRKTGKSSDDYLFSGDGKHNQSTLYRKANLDMAKKLGVSESDLAQMKISFYSGRHYWKTLMNAGSLGSGIEEYFMGHKVSKDVSLLYNHRDKQGKMNLISKAECVFAILDKSLFGRDCGGTFAERGRG